MSMKQTGDNRKPGAASASGAGGCAGATAGRHGLTRGRNGAKAHPTPVAFSGVYANMRMVHVLTSVVGAKCELNVKNGTVFEGVFKTYGPECDLVLDAAHRNGAELSVSPRREDIVESIIFKASDVVVVHFKDVDLTYAKKVSSEQDKLTDISISARLNGEHKEKDLEPWDGGDQHVSSSLESLDTDLSNGWDPDDMFKYNEETYGVKSTYDSSLSSYTVPLERDNSEEFLKREARAAQLAEEIEASATYKARVALENDERSEEEKFSAVVRDSHTFSRDQIRLPNEQVRDDDGKDELQDDKRTIAIRGLASQPLFADTRENKYIPPGQRNREAGLSWGSGRQNSPRLVQCNSGPPTPRASPHDYNTLTSVDQRVVNGGAQHWLSRCPSPSSCPSSRYQSGPNVSLPIRPPSRPLSRHSRPPSHPSAHGCPTSLSTLPKRLSLEGPPRMSPKSQRTPKVHRMLACRGVGPSGVEFMSQGASGEALTTPPARNSPSGGTWSSVVSGGHRPHSPLQNIVGGAPPGHSSSSSKPDTMAVNSVATPTSATSTILASPAPNMAAIPVTEAKEIRHNSPSANKENVKPVESSSCRPVGKGFSSMPPDHRKQIDNLKKFSVDFRLQSSSNPDLGAETMMTKSPLDPGEKLKESQCDKSMTESTGPKVCLESSGREDMSAAVGVGSKPAISPSSSSSTLSMEQKRVPDVTSQGVQTTSPTVLKTDDDEEKKDPVPESVRKSTLNPNAKEFNPRLFCSPPKPATTPTLTRPQGQSSPSIMMQQPPAVYSQQMCFPHMYPLTPVSPGVQTPTVYHLPVPHVTVSQSKTFRQGKVPSIPQQRPEQHHPAGTSPMMHPATAAGPPVVAQSPVYSTQYFTCNPPQFSTQPFVQQMPHYQSQAHHVFNPVMQGGARMITPSHGQPNLASSTTQYGEQTHTMYAPIPQQYSHPGVTLHPHPPQPPQPSATPTAQAQQSGQHAGTSHTAASPVQHTQHHASLHRASTAPPQQQMYSALTPTPPSMTPGPAPQSPQTIYIHPQQVQHSYNPNHMAHVQQAHMQSGMVPTHHGTPSHPVMLMATQAPAGPQPPLPQNSLNPIPVSSTTHFSYVAHPSVQPHHQQQL